MKKVYKLWTDEEIEFLKDNIHLTYKEIGERTNRSISSVQKKVWKLGLQEERSKHHDCRIKWTDEEIEYLKENYTAKTLEEMSVHLGRSVPTIRWKGNSLGLKRERKQRRQKAWTDEELEFLKENYGNMDAETIASKLNKTVKSIRMKASRQGLRVGAEPLLEDEKLVGVRFKCSYINCNGVKGFRESIYPTEDCEDKAAARIIDCLTKMMGYTDVKVLEVERL